MKLKYQKLTAFALLLLVACPVTIGIFMEASRFIVQYSMREALEKSRLLTIDVNQQDVVWTREGIEASLNGRLFDVKMYVVTGNHYILTGLFDADEDKLSAGLNGIDKSTPLNDKNSMQIFELINSCLQCTRLHQANDIDFVYFKSDYPVFQKQRISPMTLEKESPPPKDTLS